MGAVPAAALNRAAICFVENSGERANEGCGVGAEKIYCMPSSLSGGKKLSSVDRAVIPGTRRL